MHPEDEAAAASSNPAEDGTSEAGSGPTAGIASTPPVDFKADRSEWIRQTHAARKAKDAVVQPANAGNRLARVFENPLTLPSIVRAMTATDPPPDDPASVLPEEVIEAIREKGIAPWILDPSMRLNLIRDSDDAPPLDSGGVSKVQMIAMYRAGLLNPWISDPSKRAFPLPEETIEEPPSQVPSLGGAEE